jgi:hypothetical protein
MPPNRYDTDYQAFRANLLSTLRNMDPDDLVDTLAIDTDTLISALWIKIEDYIQQEYEDEHSEDDDYEE